MTDKKRINVPPKQTPSLPITRKEIHDATAERIELITHEFTRGFAFLKQYPKSVTFFGGTHITEQNKYYIQARSLSALIARELNYTILTGGGPGIMEAANRGAFEEGGESVGLTIELPDAQVTNPYLTNHLNLYYFFSRKVCLSFSAEAYIFFPGGYGTLDEFFEIVTLVQTHKIESVPVILVGKDYWTKLEEFLRNEMLSRGTIDPSDFDLFKITDDENEIIDIIKNAPVRNNIQLTYKLADETKVE